MNGGKSKMASLGCLCYFDTHGTVVLGVTRFVH